MKKSGRLKDKKGQLSRNQSRASVKSGGKEPKGLDYSAANKPKFYSQCWFLCCCPLTSILLMWIAAVVTNEGCPEYTIIEEL